MTGQREFNRVNDGRAFEVGEKARLDAQANVILDFVIGVSSDVEGHLAPVRPPVLLNKLQYLSHTPLTGSVNVCAWEWHLLTWVYMLQNTLDRIFES